MCGITGVVSTRDICQELFGGMQSLEYRGYDSAGMAVLSHGRLEVRKDKGKIAQVEQRQALSTMQGELGIAHTRWATHGGVNQANAHPHVSSDGQFALVHNGIIENYLSLRAELQAQGVVFQSATDSEVIVQLIAAYHAAGDDVESALIAATERLSGAFAFALITPVVPDTLFCARNESPLVIGVGDGTMYLASDVNAFGGYTRDAVYMNDHEYARLRPDGYTIKSLTTGEEIERSPETIHWQLGNAADKGPYAHYMLKEIHQGADCIETVLELPSNEIRSMAERILHAEQTFLTGVGTAYYVALIAQYFFASLANRYIPAISADEFLTLGKVDAQSLTLAVSQSGETYDTLKALRFTKTRGGQTAAIVNVPGSSMVREVDQAILQGAGPEICVLSTKSTISQVSVLLRVALELARLQGVLGAVGYREHMQALEAVPGVLREMYHGILPQVRRVASAYCQTPNWFFIGRGVNSAVALESALKFKEVSYLHAEGMSGGFLKHGTIALIDDNTHSIAFLPPTDDTPLLNATLANVQEIRARGGLVIGLHHQKDDSLRGSLDDEIVVPETPSLTAPLVQLTAGQMLAYHTALVLGRNIDKPRALAKSVTVA
ncbi:MAG: glutamine--fructose-6-phosphate transaminase (isomerizing) [bacterium]|nr:glutamine--fructose-6-phosphate transaminase (isomerizing) [bacterium]